MSLKCETSLLTRYKLNVEQLDFEFVRECHDTQTLERIIRVLRSGEEGFYPQLLRFTEDKLSNIYPESRLLIADKPPQRINNITSQESKVLQEDLREWFTKIRAEEEELLKYEVIKAPLPPIRNAQEKEPELLINLEEDIEKNLMSKKDEDKYLENGYLYLQEGNYLQASLQFQKVLSLDSLNAKALNGMAAIHNQSKSTAFSKPLIEELP